MYREFAAIEKDPGLRVVLEKLAEQERRHFLFWRAQAVRKEFEISVLTRVAFRMMRRALGFVFLARWLERHEVKMLAAYEAYAAHADPRVEKQIAEIIAEERGHEEELLANIQEERVVFLGNIILGLNDGLIELTGALVGFSFVLADHRLVVLSGLIVGIAASLSMASSAYMQARHEEGRDARKAALYTGVAYSVVVALLVLPYLIFSQIRWALPVMVAEVLVIIASISYYTAIVFNRSFARQFSEMAILSMGVAVVTFSIGFLARLYWGVLV